MVSQGERGQPRVLLDRTALPAAAAPVLDDAQRSVVAHRDGPLLVLAGPGTGKTTTLTEAIVARLTDPQRPVSPERVVALTFARKAAAELRDRVQSRLGGGVPPVVATFHSFAYALLRTLSSAEEFADPPRLLSGAEEEAAVRELVARSQDDGTVAWPADLQAGLNTFGMAREVRAVLARSKELGLDAPDLVRIGRESGRPAWAAVGELAHAVESTLALRNVVDYADLLRVVINRLHDDDVTPPVFEAIYVDEYQDTDPLQVQLLQALCSPGTSVVAVGDPDQAIYGFRGADRGGLLRFRRQFPASDGALAPVVVLDRTRRFGPELREVATAVIARQGITSDLVLDVERHRRPVCEGHSRVDAHTYESASALAANVAEQVRQAHLHDGLAWSQMAVIVRAAHQIAPLERALALAGVPVQVTIDEVPLHREPAVAALLLAVRVALPDQIPTPAQAMEVITGPIGALPPADLRAVARALRARLRTAAPDHPLPSTPQVLRAALLDPELLDGLEDLPAAGGLRRLADLLGQARELIRAKATPQDVLWHVWSGTAWPLRLRHRALRGSSSADHDLDAVIALFDAAERASDRATGAGVADFLATLAGQQVPAEAVSEVAADIDRVRILTAHRAKGLEWEFVVVAGLQEGQWPDVRPRGSVLQADRLSPDGVGYGPSLAEVLGEEERLFYVAITRARSRLLLAAVAAATDSAEPPSRFLDRLPIPVVHVAGRPPRRTSLVGLVADLRSCAQDPDASPALRQAAAERLAVLAAVQVDGRRLVPAAHPDTWWGLRDLTSGVEPVRPVDQPVRLSASAVESLHQCGLRWFLDRQAKVQTPSGAPAVFGKVIHAIVDHIAKGEVAADLESADSLVDSVWAELGFDAEFTSVLQRAEARRALERYLDYHRTFEGDVLATEAKFTVSAQTAGGPVSVLGYLDRLERDADGALRPVDIKTGKQAPSSQEVEEHIQLAIYQWAVRRGAFRSLGETSGGAALVQLRTKAAGEGATAKVQLQPPISDAGMARVEQLLEDTALRIRAEDFSAEPGAHCAFCSFTAICPTGPGQVIC